MPDADSAPSDGLRPTMPLSAAGMRPEPAVSVPSANGDEPRADRGRRTRTRSAGNKIGPQRVARNAIGRAHADQAGGELIEVGLAYDDGAGPLQPLDDEGRALRPIGEGGTRRGGRQAGDIDIVFDGEGNAPQRLALGPRCLQRLGGGKRFGLGPQRNEQRRIGVLGDARVSLLDRR